MSAATYHPSDAQLAQRAALCHERVTLDGKPAVIRGCRARFATVSELGGGPSYEWAWETVERIVNNGGNFRA